MARKRRGRPLNGWLILDKPADMTSTQAVGRVRRLTDAAKAGHGGTLDPMATGVLPIALGEATKAVSHIMDSRKLYRFAVRWGEERDTDDAEGAVVAESSARPTPADIHAHLESFTGTVRQTPPRYSAVKIDGKRAYDLAREDKDVTPVERVVEIERFDLISDVSEPDPNLTWFEVACGKGTYVRALARDLGRALGCYGHVAHLRRLAVGPFREKDAISLDKLADLSHSAPLETYLLPVETALDDIPALAVTGSEAERLSFGQQIRVPFTREGTVRVMTDNRFVAIADLEGGVLRPLRVFNL